MPVRVAIPVPTSMDESYNRQNWQVYADAVAAAGGEAVPLPLSLSATAFHHLCRKSDAFVLPGSLFDVDPASYGHVRDEACAPSDAAREATDRRVLEYALLSGKPVLGICYGMQMINVFHGGTMVQDLGIMPVNHAAGRAVQVAHTAAIAQQTLLASLLDEQELAEVDGSLRLPINSSHHQAVGVVGRGLRVAARCPQDGVVESVELDLAARDPGTAGKPFLLGVQWHPERTVDSSRSSHLLFSSLIAAAAVPRA